MIENGNKNLIIFLTRMYLPKNHPENEFAASFPEYKNREQIIEPLGDESFSVLTIHGYFSKFARRKHIDSAKTVEEIKKALNEEKLNIENYSSIRIGYHLNKDNFGEQLKDELRKDDLFKGFEDIIVNEYTESGSNKPTKEDLLEKWTGKSIPVDKRKSKNSKRTRINGVLHETVKLYTPLLFDLQGFAGYVQELVEEHTEKNFPEQSDEIVKKLVFEREDLAKLWQESTEKLKEIAESSQDIIKSFGELDSMLRKLSNDLLLEEQKETKE